MRKMMAALSATALLAATSAGTASAQVQQDGLVNVNIGDVTVTLTDTVDVAASIAATVCPNINVGAVAILAQNVDAGHGRQVTVCNADAGRVVITNN